MIPSAWQGLILGLAAFRLTRLGGWDDWPPIARLRAWVIGERWLTPPQRIARAFDVPAEIVGLEPQFPRPTMQEIGGGDVELPGKQPESEVDGVRPVYDRPLLAHLIHCPYCLGFWISLGVYVAWVFLPTETMYVCAPFALSAFVGLTAKNLDP